MRSGIKSPDFRQMGTEMPVGGNGPATPYGSSVPFTDAVRIGTHSMQLGTDSARADIGYRPVPGRADRLAANIVGEGTFGDMASGGYIGRPRT